MRKPIRAGMATLVAATIAGGLAGTPSAALASGGGGVQVTGTCSAASVSQLKAKPDNGALEVEFEVDSNVAGQTWGVILKDDGTTLFKGTATTTGVSGAFTVRRVTANQAGPDSIKAGAKNLKTGPRAGSSGRPRRRAPCRCDRRSTTPGWCRAPRPWIPPSLTGPQPTSPSIPSFRGR